MTYQFKTGDRVRYTGRGKPGLASRKAKGQLGTVRTITDSVAVEWDVGNDTARRDFYLSAGVFASNIELATEAGASRTIAINQSVVYRGSLPSLNNKRCVVTGWRRGLGQDAALVEFDHEQGRERVIYMKNLYTIPTGEAPMKNIKTLVSTAVTTLLAAFAGDSPKEAAVRKLGIAAGLVKLGEAAKKKAKAELTALGIITGDDQTGVVFDSERYVVTATTKAASSRLEANALEDALVKEGLSGAARRRIVAAATVTNKAAVSFAVETK